ncbi:hypothetical protein FGF1_40680 [Flavobacteriaceae bacterium GF1]
MLEVENFIGTWRTVDFPGCVGNNHGVITLYVSNTGIATLWRMEGQQPAQTFCNGQLVIEDNEDGTFNIRINGEAIDDEYLNIQSSTYIPNSSPSFISEIPHHGRRYFEKL